MLGKPLLAHPAKRGGVHTTGHQFGDDDDRGQHDEEAGDEQHRVVAVTRSFPGVSRSWHVYSHLSVRLCTHTQGEIIRWKGRQGP